MLELEDALGRILAAIPPAIPERVPLAAAAGRILVAPEPARVDLPPFDNSAVDGYAVRAADLAAAGPAKLVRLRLAGRVAAGEVFPGPLAPGDCLRLYTGAPLPPGADAVVMQEDVGLDPQLPGEISFPEPARPWEHVRFRGGDVKAGVTVGRAGERIGAGRVGLLAAAGVAEVAAGRQPVVGLVATGSELAETGALLPPGWIYESNRPALAALTRQCGGIPRLFPVVADTLAATRQALEEAFAACDLVVTSGGVSVGDLDFVRQALSDCGGAMEFWKVAIRPGRPFVFGRLREKLLFGLPGNPVSAFVTFFLLVRPALLRWQGAAETAPPSRPGVLLEPLANPGARRHFLRVRVDSTGRVHPTGPQESHLLGALADANGLLDMPPGISLAAGAMVPVLYWE